MCIRDRALTLAGVDGLDLESVPLAFAFLQWPWALWLDFEVSLLDHSYLHCEVTLC